MTRALLFAVVVSSAFFCVVPSRADVGPPPTDDCTVEKQCKDGQTCPTLGGEVDKDCAAGMAQKGLTLKCTQARATVAKAVFCPSAAATSKKSCGKSEIAPTSAGEGTLGFFLAATGLVAAGLRRARSRRSPTR